MKILSIIAVALLITTYASTSHSYTVKQCSKKKYSPSGNGSMGSAYARYDNRHKALEYNKIGVTSEFGYEKNSTYYGTITILDTCIRYNDYCRDYRVNALSNGKTYLSRACRDNDGYWEFKGYLEDFY